MPPLVHFFTARLVSAILHASCYTVSTEYRYHYARMKPQFLTEIHMTGCASSQKAMEYTERAKALLMTDIGGACTLLPWKDEVDSSHHRPFPSLLSWAKKNRSGFFIVHPLNPTN